MGAGRLSLQVLHRLQALGNHLQGIEDEFGLFVVVFVGHGLRCLGSFGGLQIA